VIYSWWPAPLRTSCRSMDLHDHATGSLINPFENWKITDGNIAVTPEASQRGKILWCDGESNKLGGLCAMVEAPRQGLKMIYEYPLSRANLHDSYINMKNTKLTRKALPNEFVKICKLGAWRIRHEAGQTFAFRVIGVASAQHKWRCPPMEQDDFDWNLKGC